MMFPFCGQEDVILRRLRGWEKVLAELPLSSGKQGDGGKIKLLFCDGKTAVKGQGCCSLE